jgi:phage repressor protein C with HTH and peptisase S24 domain
MMGEDTSKYEVMSNQNVKQGEKMSPYARRLKYVRMRVADQRGVGKLSQATFAKLLEVHPSAISHVEAGNTRIQPELARAIEEKTGFRQAWLLTGEGPETVFSAATEQLPPAEELRSPVTPLERSYAVQLPAGSFVVENVSFSFVKKVKPLLSSGSGDLVYEEQSEDFYSFRSDWLSRKGVVASMRMAQVSGDSMLPTLTDGDFVLFDTSKRAPLDGKIMVIGIDDHLYIKRVRVSPEGIFLVSDNKAVYEPWRINPENTRFLGLVIWHCGDV